MRLIVTGHREEKLQTYDIDWVVLTLHSLVYTLKTDKGISLAYSGMASGVDLWFCEACVVYDIPFIACIPFEEQSNYMVPETKLLRESMLSYAKEKKLVKNSWMIDNCDYAIVVWDGNKGGTHNVLQQLIEKQIDFTWINPVSKKIWNCV
jgi:uncharacterized phage-like protein YoqJ